MFKYTLFLPLLFCATFLSAQELIFENISSRIGLPSAECYNVTQDLQGYIWIATEQGLLRFDGTRTRTFGAKENLPEKATYAATLDRSGKMWFVTSKNRILVFENDSLKEFRYPTEPTKLPGLVNLGYMASRFGNELLFQFSRKSLLIDPKKGTYRALPQPGISEDLVLVKSRDAFISNNSNATYTTGIPRTDIGNSFGVLVSDGSRTHRFSLSFDKKYTVHWRILALAAGEMGIAVLNNKLIRIGPDLRETIVDLPSTAISCYKDRDGGIWIGLVRNGLIYIPDLRNLDLQVRAMGTNSVSGICEDNEGNLWCTTLESGTFLSYGKRIKRYGHHEYFRPPSRLLEVGSRVFVAPQNGGIYEFGTNAGVKEISGAAGKQVRTLFAVGNRIMIGSQEGLIATGQTFAASVPVKFEQTPIFVPDLSLQSATADPGLPVFAIGYDRIWKVTGTNAKVATKIRSTGRCIQYLDPQRLVYGCSNGLYIYDLKDGSHYKFPQIDQSVTSIISIKRGDLLVGTRGKGLYRLSGRSLQRIDQTYHLGTDVFHALTIDEKGGVWAGTNRGILKLDFSGNKIIATRISRSEGMPAGDIYQIASKGEQIFFQYQEGIGNFSSSRPLQSTPPPKFLHLKSEMDEIQLPAGRPIKVPSGNHKLSFQFSNISYRNTSNRIRYRLKKTNQFTVVEGSQIILENLRPDHYLLEAYAIDVDGKRSNEVFRVPIFVESPFWQRWWFIATYAVLGLVISYLLWRLREKKMRERENQRNRIKMLIAQSKLSAIQARMNPHFIFNAINSIQLYIMKNEAGAAQAYLTKFAKLVRLVLRQSGEKIISLAEEIETLRLYVELEKMRFKDAFEFFIAIDPEINPQLINVPTMFIQPYVENAIWHGLTNLSGERKGKLEITIYALGNELTITVTDNGIGRKKAAELRSEKSYASAGMMLTEQRLATMKDIFPGSEFLVKITDLEQGTRVSLTISIDLDLTKDDYTED